MHLQCEENRNEWCGSFKSKLNIQFLTTNPVPQWGVESWRQKTRVEERVRLKVLALDSYTSVSGVSFIPILFYTKNLPAMQETRIWPLGQEDLLEKGMAIHSSIFAWKIPWTEEPDRLSPQSSKEFDATEWLTLLLLAELFIFQLTCAVLIKYKCFIHIVLVDIPRNPMKLELLPSICIWGNGGWEKLQNLLRTFSYQVMETEFWSTRVGSS